MRRGTWAIAVGVVMISVVWSGGAAPVDAQVSGNTVTVKVRVLGTAPPGTKFVESLYCADPTPPVPTATFDATGQPLDTNVFPVPPPAGNTTLTTCLAYNPYNQYGATSVNYQCEFTHGANDPNGTLGTCGSPTANAATFGDVTGDSATITIVYTYDASVTTTVTTATPAPTRAPAVAARPSFTG